MKSISRDSTPLEWKEADEIVPHVWLGTLTENEHARRKNINEVICISKDPQADLQSEGFRNAPDLEAVTFTIDSDTEGDMLWIFGEVYDIIDKILAEMKGVLMWDTGGGVAMMAAYVMKKEGVGMAEAMTIITRARLKRENIPHVPSQRIIDMLHNEVYQGQLDTWEACKYDIFANFIVNPDEPREKWIVKRVDESVEEKGDDVGGVQPALKKSDKRYQPIAHGPRRLSTIQEDEEETARRRLSTIEEK